MKTNLSYFEISISHKEQLLDENYCKIVDKRMIPLTVNEKNALTTANEKVLRYIDTIQTLIYDMKFSIDSTEIKDVISRIIDELNTKGMNYSAFCQYFLRK